MTGGKLKIIVSWVLINAVFINAYSQNLRQIVDFNKDWLFTIGDDKAYSNKILNTSNWRRLDLPHDWSIEGKFDSTYLAGNAGGALPGGIGWYRKTFDLNNGNDKKVYVEFDGVYRNSEVWINGHYLGKWPYGYTAFRYELTSYLKAGKNLIAVRVDNSQQPNSRWYSGSGIYRDVKLVTTGETAIKHWGLFVTTPKVSNQSATVNIAIDLDSKRNLPVKIVSQIFDKAGRQVAQSSSTHQTDGRIIQKSVNVKNPVLWDTQNPYLYKLVTTVYNGNKVIDNYCTSFGIRYFNFDTAKGFSLNGKPMKILGVCQHHDLGALGAAFNESAARRQLRILKEMGVNAIRMAHNPPAARLLDLCDEMGFLVMDESFDMWAKKKNKFDYYSNFPEWHQRDLEHMVRRDRNHPSIIMWSIGNEIREQFDSTGLTITKDLVRIVKELDTTRPVTCALSESEADKNFIYKSGALDVIGFNYKIDSYKDFPKNYPGQKLIASENVSGLSSRGHYDMPSDSLRLWPSSSKFKYVENGNADYSVSAYDNVAAYWGVSHETNWRAVKKYPWVSGLFVWSGFDFLGEPVPYPYPARSSYYGIIDMAGFPKDVYYMYQSEWTDKPMLHLLPHWNWQAGQIVDVKAYYNNADAVELFLNGKSLGKKTRQDSAYHIMWRLPFEPGELKAVSYKNNRVVLEKVIKTAGAAYKLELSVENKEIDANKDGLSFVTIKVLDKEGNLVPDAANLIHVSIAGPAKVAGMDNGYPADLNSMKDAEHNAYKGLLLAMIKGTKKGKATVTFTAVGLEPATTEIIVD